MATTGAFLQMLFNGANAVNGIKQWDAQDQSGKLDDADAETNGYTATSGGLAGVRLTIRGIHDPAGGPFPTIRNGTTFTNVKAFSNRTVAVPDYFLPVATALGPARTAKVDGQIEYSFDVENYGYFEIDGQPGRGT